MDHLSDMIVRVFGRLVHLKELTYNDLPTIPEVLTCSSFELKELKTTGDGLSKAFQHLHSQTIADNYRTMSPLASVEMLSVDLFNPSLHLSDLRLLSVTHLFLDRCFFESLPDLRHGLPSLPNLLSLRITWSAVHAHYGVAALWPTHILGDVPAPHLRRLEVCEWKTQRPSVRQILSDSLSCASLTNALQEPLRADLVTDVSSHLRRVRDACPSITSLVWLPSDYHRFLASGAASRSQFCEALRAYTEGVFAAWPTLESFERTNLEADGGYRKFVRGEGGRVSDVPSQFCEEGWRLI